jgi:NADH-quinone oxidoreductase subunit E
MGCSCQEKNLDQNKPLQEVINNYRGQAGSLVAILQEVQSIFGYLPKPVMSYIGKELGLKPAKIYGVATFYTQFRLTPVGKNVILLCQGTACHVNGAERLETAICQELGIEPGETTEDQLFTLNTVACLGCCSLAPVMMVNDQVYGPLTPDKAVKVLKEIAQQEKSNNRGGEEE